MLPSKLLCTIGHFATVSGDGQCLYIFVLCIEFRFQKLQLFCIKCMNNVKQLRHWHGNISSRIAPNSIL